MDENTLKKYQSTAAQKATYIDENGQKQTGTVLTPQKIASADTASQYKLFSNEAAQSGNTATAAAQTAQTAAAQETAAAQTAAAQETAADAGTAAGTETLAGLYQRIYDETTAANEKARLAANAEAARLAEEQKQTAAQSYADTNRGLYTDYRNAVRTLPEQLAAYGINGGLAESSRVKLESGYSGDLAANERARLAGEQQIASALATQQYQNQATADAANQTALNAYQQQQAELAQSNAEMLAQIGDYSGYVEIGLISEDEAKKMKKAWIAKNPKLAKKLGYVKSKKKTYSGKSSGGDGGDGVETITTEELKGATDEQYKQISAAVQAGTMRVIA